VLVRRSIGHRNKAVVLVQSASGCETKCTIDAGLLIQNAEAVSGNGSISSQRATPAAARCRAVADVSWIVSCNHKSADWLKLHTHSTHSWLAPNSNPTDAEPGSLDGPAGVRWSFVIGVVDA
jgi:hypothetical protein